MRYVVSNTDILVMLKESSGGYQNEKKWLSWMFIAYFMVIWSVAVEPKHWTGEACWQLLLPCVCRWWASWVTPAVFPHSRNTTSPFHHCTAPWTPLHPMPSQPAAASVQLSPPLRRWTAFRRRSPTAPRRTAPLVTAWTQLWRPPATSTVSTARVSPATFWYVCMHSRVYM